ncbi:DUF2291 domain-containing protein [Rhodobacter capsulatus]|uniref:DUF2291 domain-containing protein n=1 Tax=Rhodobacter capsulatus TaxID=1061 RepID=UPI0040284E26
MKSPVVTALCLAVALGTTGCKIVPKTAENSAAPAADASGDAARITKLLAESYDAKLLPLIASQAQTAAALRAQIAGGLDAAGKAHGARGAGNGSPWNFALKDQGKVIKADLDTRARTLELDTDGDGGADLTLQLGPVIKGNALRDVAPKIYDFTAFRDQMEFGKLGRALNDRASAGLTVPTEDPTGKIVAFTGVVSLRAASDKWLVTPTAIEVLP